MECKKRVESTGLVEEERILDNITNVKQSERAK